MAVKRFADELGWSLSKEKNQSLYAKGQVDSTQLTLILPQTFMNLSGDAVAAWKGREGLDPARDLLVIFDDMDLSFGKLRIRAEGSGGSHNGMASLIERLGTRRFSRLRLGIGKPENPEAWADYVTQKFTTAEKAPLQGMLERAVKGARSWLTNTSFEKLMAEVNG